MYINIRRLGLVLEPFETALKLQYIDGYCFDSFGTIRNNTALKLIALGKV